MKMLLLFLLVLISFFACDFKYSEHKMEPLLSENDNQQHWLEYLDAQIESSPRKSQNYYRKALILLDNQDYDEAISMLRKAVSLEPDNIDYRYKLSKAFYEQGEFVSGLKEARLVEGQDKSKPGLNQLLAILYLKVGELEKAQEYLQRALDQDPFSENSHLYNGFLLMAKNDTLKAEEAVLRSLDLKYSPKAIEALIDVSLYKKDFGKAFAYLNQVLKSDSLNQTLLLKKVDLFELTGKSDSARIVLNQLVKMDSLQPEYYKRLGKIHLNASRLDSALFYHNKVLKFDQNNTEALLTLARIHDRRGFYSSAIDFYKQVLVVDSTFQVAKDELDKLNNKIAYLQRIKRERESMQNIEQIQLKPIAKPQL